MTRVFLDVGAHYGETARIALNPKWGFRRVYSFEPSRRCIRQLERIRDHRLTVVPAALSNRSGTATLHGAGLLGGSLYADKTQAQDVEAEEITLIRASDWFAGNLPEGSTVYLKINCEGGEADILEDLLDSGEIHKVTRAFIHFDVSKVPSQAHRQAEIERRLMDAKVPYDSAEGFGFLPRHRTGEAWLEWHCPQVRAPLSKRLAYAIPDRYELLRSILPRRAYWWLGHRFGRLARRA